MNNVKTMKYDMGFLKMVWRPKDSRFWEQQGICEPKLQGDEKNATCLKISHSHMRHELERVHRGLFWRPGVTVLEAFHLAVGLTGQINLNL